MASECRSPEVPSVIVRGAYCFGVFEVKDGMEEAERGREVRGQGHAGLGLYRGSCQWAIALRRGGSY